MARYIELHHTHLEWVAVPVSRCARFGRGYADDDYRHPDESRGLDEPNDCLYSQHKRLARFSNVD